MSGNFETTAAITTPFRLIDQDGREETRQFEVAGSAMDVRRVDSVTENG